MDVKSALVEQYRGGLSMLAECIERCPEDLWGTPLTPAEVDPNNPEWNGVERSFWRIAFHTAFFTQVYLVQDEAAFRPPPSDLEVMQRDDLADMWRDPSAVEPYELPIGTSPCSKAEILEYVTYLSEQVGPILDQVDLASPESGFRWYENISKLSHELMNLRHLQGHVGQLSELLMLRGIDTGWSTKC